MQASWSWPLSRLGDISDTVAWRGLISTMPRLFPYDGVDGGGVPAARVSMWVR